MAYVCNVDETGVNEHNKYTKAVVEFVEKFNSEKGKSEASFALSSFLSHFLSYFLFRLFSVLNEFGYDFTLWIWLFLLFCLYVLGSLS